LYVLFEDGNQPRNVYLKKYDGSAWIDVGNDSSSYDTFSKITFSEGFWTYCEEYSGEGEG